MKFLNFWIESRRSLTEYWAQLAKNQIKGDQYNALTNERVMYPFDVTTICC